LTTGDLGQAIGVVVVMVAAQQIDNHFITPYVMQRAVKLHPAAVILALLAGGSIAGFAGLLVAVPTAAVLKIVVGHLWRVHILGEPVEEWQAAAEAEDDAPATGLVAAMRERVEEERTPTAR
jgi:predicted PurR-regulated permease PerM